jgi:hexosaminidase
MSKPKFYLFFCRIAAMVRATTNHLAAMVRAFTNHLHIPTNHLSTLIFFTCTMLISASIHAQAPVQLAPPLLKFKSIFFNNTATAKLQFAQQGTRIYYTLNNQTPTIKSQVYSKPITINKNFTTIKAITAGAVFSPSEIVSATFIKDGLKIKSVQQTIPNERYPGSGATTLIDNKGGLTAINAGTWLGYQTDSVEINITLQQSQPIASVLLNCFQDQGSWIFLPQQITVYFFDKTKQSFQFIKERFDTNHTNIAGASCQPITISFPKKVTTDTIKIILKGIKYLPDWHQGKGQPGWLFIDEIKLY